MADADITFSLDWAALQDALEGESLKAVIRTFVQPACEVSASHIRDEAIARLERQLVAGVGKGFGGHPTGTTAAGIVIKKLRSGWGYLVDAANADQPALDLWLERGTKQMPARPFFFDSARLEQQAHQDRIGTAIQDALSEYGFAEGQGT